MVLVGSNPKCVQERFAAFSDNPIYLTVLRVVGEQGQMWQRHDDCVSGVRKTPGTLLHEKCL